MRGFYGLPPEAFCSAARHLLGMPQVTVEHYERVNTALERHQQGLDFTDALHWAGSSACQQLVSFSDRGFVRLARRLAWKPAVMLPA